VKKIIIAVGSVVGFALLIGWCAGGKSEDLLKVSAGRGPTEITITNHEATALRDCKLHVEDSSGTSWVASVERDLDPSASVTVAWSDFWSNDQPMPGYIGRDRGVTISCDVSGAGGQRKSAGFGR
jgi:hypothetical protein